MPMMPDRMRGSLRALRFVLLFGLALGACAPLIAEYDAEAYKIATTLKAETLALMDKGSEPYLTRRAEVEAVTTKINAAYEYAAGLPSNQVSAAQWQILRNPDGNLYGGFVRRWRTDRNRLKPGYIAEKKIDVADMFDFIICLEANKKESKPCTAVRSADDRQRPAAGGGSQ